MDINDFEKGKLPMRTSIPDTGAMSEPPGTIMRKKPRAEPQAPIGDIYDRARIIFSRARSAKRSRSASIF